MFWLLTPLWVLFLILRGTLINQAGGGRVSAMVKAQVTEARFTSLISNGGSFGGNIHVNGDHYVTGDHTTTGTVSGGSLSSGGTVYINDHNLSRVGDVNPGNEAWGSRGALYMNGHDIFLGGATIHP
jgi:hypothetical protein